MPSELDRLHLCLQGQLYVLPRQGEDPVFWSAISDEALGQVHYLFHAARVNVKRTSFPYPCHNMTYERGATCSSQGQLTHASMNRYNSYFATQVRY